MDDPYILEQDRITSTGHGWACTETPGTKLCHLVRGGRSMDDPYLLKQDCTVLQEGVNAWMPFICLNRTILQVPNMGGPVR